MRVRALFTLSIKWRMESVLAGIRAREVRCAGTGAPALARAARVAPHLAAHHITASTQHSTHLSNIPQHSRTFENKLQWYTHEYIFLLTH